MADKKITDLQQVAGVTEQLNMPVDDTLQTYRMTVAQLKAFLAPIYIPDLIDRKTSGSGTIYRPRAFVCTSASCTVGATYTHNSVTWTVLKTVASGTIVYLSGNGNPLTSGTLTKASGTGDSTITFSSYREPIQVHGVISGGGGGGGGAGASGTAGTDGNDSTFGGIITAAKGLKGGANGGGPGAGGSNTITPTTGLSIIHDLKGGSGQFSGRAINTATGDSTTSGLGGMNLLGGGSDNTGTVAPNSGAGGGGGFNNAAASTTTAYGGDGGGAGAYCEFLLTESAIASSFAYSVGASVSGGSGSGSGQSNGGAGAAGVLVLRFRFQ